MICVEESYFAKYREIALSYTACGEEKMYNQYTKIPMAFIAYMGLRIWG